MTKSRGLLYVSDNETMSTSSPRESAGLAIGDHSHACR